MARAPPDNRARATSCYRDEVLAGVNAWLVRLRKLLGVVLMGLGITSLVVGILVGLSGGSIALAVLWLLGASGLLLLGLGLLFVWPFSAGVSVTASIFLLVSSALFVVLFAIDFPFLGPGAFVFAGAIAAVGLLALGWSARLRRKRSGGAARQ